MPEQSLYGAPLSGVAVTGWVLAAVVALLLAACAVRAELRPAGPRRGVDEVLAGVTIGAVAGLLVVLALVVRAGLA